MTGIQGLGWRGQGGRCQGSWSVGVDDFLDPADVFADPGVDSRVLGRAAGVSTPGKDALQGLVTHKGATRVTLAGVLALVHPGTDHVVGEDSGVEDLTLSGAQESDPGTAQGPVVLHSSRGCGPPAGHVAALSRAGAAGGQPQGLGARPQHHRAAQLQQHEVMIICPPGQDGA